MPKFFVSPSGITGDSIILSGEDAAHIAKTLRMRKGDALTVCDGEGTDYACTLLSVSPDIVEARIESGAPCPGEPALSLTLCMALPKSDKLELVVQKAVELGASRVCVFRSGFCVPDPDPRTFARRLTRLQKIAREAAGQSLRGRIPEIEGLFSFAEMLKRTGDCDMPLFFYESGGIPLKTLLDAGAYRSAALVIGPEGGFSEKEAQTAAEAGFHTAHLGARILRCETAAISAVAAVMFHAGEFA